MCYLKKYIVLFSHFFFLFLVFFMNFLLLAFHSNIYIYIFIYLFFKVQSQVSSNLSIIAFVYITLFMASQVISICFVLLILDFLTTWLFLFQVKKKLLVIYLRIHTQLRLKCCALHAQCNFHINDILKIKKFKDLNITYAGQILLLNAAELFCAIFLTSVGALNVVHSPVIFGAKY